jgi:hypothetical protein
VLATIIVEWQKFLPVAEMTGRELQRVIGRGSHQGIRNAADRLAEQGVVSRRSAGNANLYRLNRDHVAASWIEGLAGLPAQVLQRLRDAISGWGQPPELVVLFGSVARGEATPESDLDLLVVRPADCEPDEPVWQEQLAKLQAHASAWTGNDARVLEFGEQELTDGEPQQVLTDAARDGIELYGTLRLLRRGSRAHSTRRRRADANAMRARSRAGSPRPSSFSKAPRPSASSPPTSRTSPTHT